MLINKIKIINRNQIFDERGWFLKVLHGNEENLGKEIGEFYLTLAKENQSRGGHYHEHASEWFTLVQGECILELIDVVTEEYCAIPLSALHPRTIYVPNNVAHNFKNTSNADFLLLAYTNVKYDPADTIDYSFVK